MKVELLGESTGSNGDRMQMWRNSIEGAPGPGGAAPPAPDVTDVAQHMPALMGMLGDNPAGNPGGGSPAPGAIPGQNPPYSGQGGGFQQKSPAAPPAQHVGGGQYPGGNGFTPPAGDATSGTPVAPPAAPPAVPKPAPASGPATPPAGGAQPAGDKPAGSGSGVGAAGTPGVGVNAGGVKQAAAISGVDPNAKQVVQTGTGDSKVYNVTNATNRDQSFTYSVQGVNKGTVTLKPGETGAFVAGNGDLGVRITPSKADGTNGQGVVLYEDGAAGSGQAAGAGNADISKVDGTLDSTGRPVNMTVTLSDGRTAGDGDAIHAYQYPTDDAASMGLAGDTSATANIVLSDA